MSRNYKITFIVLLLLTHAKVYARDWASYSSENFTIYSDQKPKSVIALLKEFEVFRGLVLAVTGIQNKPENAKMKILVYAKGGEYRDIGPKNTIGFYTNSSAGPRMVVGPDSRTIDKSEILYHEYIHYLLREHSTAIYPRWYDEGFAEVLGATTIKRGKATLGSIPQSRSLSISYERPFKVRDLLIPDREKDDSRSYQSRFYAYAWLFTHYLQISSFTPENEHLKIQAADFINRYNQGESPLTAFEASFQITPEQMDDKLEDYRHQRRITVMTFEVNEYQGEITQSPLSHNEEVFLLADIAWRVGKEDIALEYLDDIDPKQADAAQALSLAAVLENHKENFQSAGKYADQAIALAPNDPMVLTNLSHWQLDSYNHDSDQESSADLEQANQHNKAQLLQAALQYGQQAIDTDPSNLESHRFVWESQLEQGDDIGAVRTMMAAYGLSPSSLSINFTIGNFLLKFGKPQLARPFMERVLNWTHLEEQRAAIQKVLDRIDQAALSTTSEQE